MCVQIRSSIFRTFMHEGTPDPQCPLIQVFFIIRKKGRFFSVLRESA